MSHSSCWTKVLKLDLLKGCRECSLLPGGGSCALPLFERPVHALPGRSLPFIYHSVPMAERPTTRAQTNAKMAANPQVRPSLCRSWTYSYVFCQPGFAISRPYWLNEAVLTNIGFYLPSQLDARRYFVQDHVTKLHAMLQQSTPIRQTGENHVCFVILSASKTAVGYFTLHPVGGKFCDFNSDVFDTHIGQQNWTALLSQAEEALRKLGLEVGNLNGGFEGPSLHVAVYKSSGTAINTLRSTISESPAGRLTSSFLVDFWKDKRSVGDAKEVPPGLYRFYTDERDAAVIVVNEAMTGDKHVLYLPASSVASDANVIGNPREIPPTGHAEHKSALSHRQTALRRVATMAGLQLIYKMKPTVESIEGLKVHPLCMLTEPQAIALLPSHSPQDWYDSVDQKLKRYRENWHAIQAAQELKGQSVVLAWDFEGNFDGFLLFQYPRDHEGAFTLVDYLLPPGDFDLLR
jgi:hypothetical protein